MKSTKNLFVDIINLLPKDLVCYFRAHGLGMDVLQNINATKGADSTIVMRINDFNKNRLIDFILSTHFYHEIERIEMLYNGKLLFEAWDGFDVGIISKTIGIPEWFQEAGYLDDVVSVSNDW